MATYLGTGAIFQVMSGATAGNLGGGGFNPTNTNFIANWTATAANTSSPVIASVSYSFVAGDVGAWFYVKSGTNWTQGWYQIASVSVGAATLSAGIGAAIQVSNNKFITNTVAGCATTASPTSGNCGIDYSQATSARYTATDLTGTTTSCTSATNPFTTSMVGNLICLSSGTGVTAGWYEIVSVSGSTATLDRTAGATYSAVTYYTGGAVSLGGSTAGITDTIFFALGASSATVACRFFIQGNATYTVAGAPTVLGGNVAFYTGIEGYNSVRGDRPTGSARPTLATGANQLSFGTYMHAASLIVTTTSFSISSSGSLIFEYCSFINKSTTALQSAFGVSGTDAQFIGCEFVSYNGYGLNDTSGNNIVAIGCYFHDSVYGFANNANNGSHTISKSIFCNCTTAAFGWTAGNNTTHNNIVDGNTFYGAENKLGTGVFFGGGPLGYVTNNIFYGFVTAVNNSGSTLGIGFDDYNCYYNNTTNGNTWSLGSNNITSTNPTFTNVAQVTGTTATSATNVLTDGGKNFTTAGVVAGRDYLLITAATGATVARYGITAVGTTTITCDNTIGTGSSITYQITTGRNFLPTGAI